MKCIEIYNATIKGKKEESKTNWEPIGQDLDMSVKGLKNEVKVKVSKEQ